MSEASDLITMNYLYLITFSINKNKSSLWINLKPYFYMVIENDGDYVKRITAISQGDTNDHIVYVINGTGGSGETSNSLCVFEYQN